MAGRWVRDERRRMEVAKGTELESLSGDERAELARLRRQVIDLRKDNGFMGKAGHFAANPPKRSDSR